MKKSINRAIDEPNKRSRGPESSCASFFGKLISPS